jgi:hypothetical protein
VTEKALRWLLRWVLLKGAGGHLYLSTACLHNEHVDCRINGRRYDGTYKVAAQCKYCGTRCVCSCHEEECQDAC